MYIPKGISVDQIKRLKVEAHFKIEIKAYIVSEGEKSGKVECCLIKTPVRYDKLNIELKTIGNWENPHHIFLIKYVNLS